MLWFNRRRILILLSFFLLLSCSNSDIPSKLKVIYMFDDNNITDYSIAFMIFENFEEEYNIKLSATTYVIVNKIGNDPNYCDLDQLKDMYNNGWEIASHSMTHPIMIFLSDSLAEYELVKSRDSLINMGFNVTNFAFPYGTFNDNLLRKATRYYFYVRDINDRYWKKPLDRTHLGCFVVEKNDVVETCLRRVNLALMREEDYVIFLFHRLDYGDKDVTPEDFQELTRRLIEDYKLYPSSFFSAVSE